MTNLNKMYEDKFNLINFEEILKNNSILCLIYISCSRVYKKGDKFSIIIKWKKTFETKYIEHNHADFYADILSFLKIKKLDTFFEIVNENFEYIILTLSDENKIYEYYLKYLNLSFAFIKKNLNYKENKIFFIQDFLSVFFGLRGTYRAVHNMCLSFINIHILMKIYFVIFSLNFYQKRL